MNVPPGYMVVDGMGAAPSPDGGWGRLLLAALAGGVAGFAAGYYVRSRYEREQEDERPNLPVQDEVEEVG